MNEGLGDVRAGFTRRSVLKGAAWSLPVVAAAVAVPLAAASGEVTGTGVVNKYDPSVGSWNSGQVVVNSVQVWYDANAFAGVNSQDTPLNATVTWDVVLTKPDGTIVGTIVPEQSDSLARFGNVQKSSVSISGVAAGTYLVVSRILSVTYTPNPYKSTVFVTDPSSASTSVTVH